MLIHVAHSQPESLDLFVGRNDIRAHNINDEQNNGQDPAQDHELPTQEGDISTIEAIPVCADVEVIEDNKGTREACQQDETARDACLEFGAVEDADSQNGGQTGIVILINKVIEEQEIDDHQEDALADMDAPERAQEQDEAEEKVLKALENERGPVGRIAYQ